MNNTFNTLVLCRDVSELSAFNSFSKDTLLIISENINDITANSVSPIIFKQNSASHCDDSVKSFISETNERITISLVSSLSETLSVSQNNFDFILTENVDFAKKIYNSVSAPTIAFIGKKEDAFSFAGSEVSGIAVSADFLNTYDLATLSLSSKQALMRGAIFDLDGTLLDSMPYWENIAEKFLKTLGITPKPNLNQTVLSMSFKESSAYIKKEYSLSMSCDEIIDSINKMAESYYYNDIKLKNGTDEMLKSFVGVKKYVCTLTASHLAVAALKRNGIWKHFDGIVSAADLGLDKSSAKIYNLTLEKLATQKKYTYVFEDSAHSAKTAKSDGFTVIGVSDAQTSRKKIENFCDFYTIDYNGWK